MNKNEIYEQYYLAKYLQYQQLLQTLVVFLVCCGGIGVIAFMCLITLFSIKVALFLLADLAGLIFLWKLHNHYETLYKEYKQMEVVRNYEERKVIQRRFFFQQQQKKCKELAEQKLEEKIMRWAKKKGIN